MFLLTKVLSQNPILNYSATLLITMTLLGFSAGCGRRVIFVQPGTFVRTDKELKGVGVWAPDDKGELIYGTADIPAGAPIAIPKKEK